MKKKYLNFSFTCEGARKTKYAKDFHSGKFLKSNTLMEKTKNDISYESDNNFILSVISLQMEAYYVKCSIRNNKNRSKDYVINV